MSLHAAWNVYDPEGLPADGEMTVHSPEDVDRLVALLVEPSAEPASVVHSARALTVSPYSGETVPDHLMWAFARDGYGYFLYYSAEHRHCRSVGDPASAAFEYDYNEFAAGSGVSLEVFARGLKEFLATASRPACLEWRDEY